MKKICFFDLKNDGHHWNYNKNVIKSKISKEVECIYYTNNIDKEKKDYLEKLNVKVKIIKELQNSILNNFIIILDLLLFCKKYCIDELYILYLDPYIMQLNILRKLYRKKIVATLHWYPNKKIKEYILNQLKYNIILIVHTDKISKKLNENCKLIYYPKFENEDLNLKKLSSNKEKLTLLYFGALRFDKGVDILLESLNYIKSDFKLIIAGKASTFSKDFVMNKIKKFDRSKFIIDINYISDEKMNDYYEMADIVVLPYREHFMGESGILVDSLSKGKVIISTKISNAKQIINENHNGELFEFEDFKELAYKIDKVIENYKEYHENAVKSQKKFIEKHSIKKFIEAYKNI